MYYPILIKGGGWVGNTLIPYAVGRKIECFKSKNRRDFGVGGVKVLMVLVFMMVSTILQGTLLIFIVFF